MQLIDYIPPFLKEIKEFKEIFATEDIELEKLNNAIDEISREMTIKTAESYGLERYEKIYNIIPASTVEERRFNILSKINDRVPFTIRWLRNKLTNLVGEENYRIDLKHDEYKITIEVAMLFEDIANTLNNDLRKQLPANMLLTVNLFNTNRTNLYIGSIVHIGKQILVRNEV